MPFLIATFFHTGMVNKTRLRTKKVMIEQNGKPRSRLVLKAFPLRLGTRQGCTLLSPLFNTVLEVLDKTIKQEKQIKR